MENEPSNDINVNVLGTGCLASFGLACLVALVMICLVLAMGIRAAASSTALVIFGALLGTTTRIAVGYIIARAAIARSAAVNFHIIVFGIILMVIGLIGWVIPQKNIQLSGDVAMLTLMLRVIGWLLIIPLLLLGASWAKAENPE